MDRLSVGVRKFFVKELVLVDVHVIQGSHGDAEVYKQHFPKKQTLSWLG